MKKVMVSGANGFIGAALTAYLARQGTEVYAIVKDETENLSGLDALTNVHIIYCDLFSAAQLPDLTAARELDCFFHLAWAGVDGPNRRNAQLQLSNVAAAVDCLQAAKQLGCRKFVGVGSFMEKEAYRSLSQQGLSANPSYLYGACKLSAHMLSKLTAAALDMEFCWGVITNAFGVGDTSNRFINYVLRSVAEHTPLQLTSCEQTYDFLYIDDVVRALYLVGEYGKNNKEYIIGSGNARPLKSFVEEALAVLDASEQPQFGAVPFRGVSVPAEMMNAEDIKTDCGFVPAVSFAEGVRRTYAWMQRCRGDNKAAYAGRFS